MESPDSFERDEQSGILLPKPKGKSVRMLVMSGGMPLEVTETMDEITAKIDHANQSDQTWVEFTDPSFGEHILVPLAAFNSLLWILEGWKDMSAAAEQIKQRDLAMRRQGSPIQQVPAGVVPLNREQRRRNGLS
jgi:hypothetical protein